MRKKGIAVFYALLSLFIVMIVGFMLMKYMFLKNENICSFEDQGACCISIMDRCDAESGSCIIGTCEQEDCRNRCGNETYCILYPALTGDPDDDDDRLHACISETCLGNVGECSPVECTMAAFRYDPKNDEGIGEGKDWWLVLDTAKENSCCQVNEESGGLTKTCSDELK